jgi:YD repeat-containing protein
VVDPLGRTTTVNYNNRGWETDQTDPASMMNQFQYNGVGRRTWVMTTGGGMSMSASFTYDDLGRMIRHTDELNNATNYEFDSNGNRTAVIDPLGHRTSFGYDARDRLISVTTTDPDGAGPLAPSVTTYTYDAAGNQIRVTDPLGRQTNTAYDAAGRRAAIIDAMGGVVNFGYDNADRMTSLTDPVNNTTSWTIDAAGRTTAETDPLGKSRTFVFNAASELVRVTDRNNPVRDFVYDLDGRRTQELWCGVGVPPATPCSNPLRTIAYTYNAASELTQAADPDSTYALTYDTAGRVLTIDNAGTPNMPQVTLTNAYDGIGNRTSLADNHGGQTTFGYDAIRRMTRASLIVSGGIAAEAYFTYDAASRLTLLSRQVPGYSGNPPMPTPKTDTSYSYDNADRLTGITHQNVPMSDPPITLAAYSYVYNAANELASETHADGTFNYTYDLTGQLNGVDANGGTCGPTVCDESFAYDLNGNRITSTGYGQSQTYTTGTENRLLSDGVYNYTYDDEGNTLTRTRITDNQITELSWDHRNRLAQVLIKNASGTILTQANYTYDVFNRRIIAIVDSDGSGPQPSVSTATVFDALQPPTAGQVSSGAAAPLVDAAFESAAFSANPIFDFVDPDGSGPQPSTLDARRLYGFAVDMLIARRNASGTVAWYLADHLGTVRDIANTSGTVVDHVSYSAYGKVTSESQSSIGDRFKFTSTARRYLAVSRFARGP